MEVTKETIAEWKAKYKFIYRIPDGNDYIYFHPLTRSDYQDVSIEQMNSENEAYDFEFEIVKRCVLGVEDVESLRCKSGIITALADNIMVKSGFQQVEAEEL